MAAYIKFDGVEGESLHREHKNWSDLMSFSQMVHKPGAGGTGAARRRGSVMLEDLQCAKLLDKASPKIAESVCKGKVFPKVEIESTVSTTDAGQVCYYKYELKNVLVSSYSVSGGAQDKPAENFSLNFEEIKVTYTEMDSKGKSKGNVEYAWKVEEDEAG